VNIETQLFPNPFTEDKPELTQQNEEECLMTNRNLLSSRDERAE
jgi:hypothetical protein